MLVLSKRIETIHEFMTIHAVFDWFPTRSFHLSPLPLPRLARLPAHLSKSQDEDKACQACRPEYANMSRQQESAKTSKRKPRQTLQTISRAPNQTPQSGVVKCDSPYITSAKYEPASPGSSDLKQLGRRSCATGMSCPKSNATEAQQTKAKTTTIHTPELCLA
jgi:hypothetical protein